MTDIACTGVLFSVQKCRGFTNLAEKSVGMEHKRSTGNIGRLLLSPIRHA
jgi:hypothetical protein